MKVRFLGYTTWCNRRFYVGDVEDLSGEVADFFIKVGKAEKYKETKEEEIVDRKAEIKPKRRR